MSAFANAAVAGAAGAATTNILHETIRRLTPQAPRIDLVGMQALAKILSQSGSDVPTGKALYYFTLAGDLASNTAYFALVGAAPRERAIAVGCALGTVAGIGAVLLPPRMDLAAAPTQRTPTTRLLTVALYAAGGLTAGLVRRRRRS